jgi:uncharacterized protein (TIGR03790 family)
LLSAAPNPGDEVVVVYNSRVPESRGVAEHYAKARNVPQTQVFGFELPATEDMSRPEFQDSLQKPLAGALAEKQLWRIAESPPSPATNEAGRVERRVVESKIRYLVLCHGVPLRILPDLAVNEDTEKLRPELRRNEAAVDSELALLPLLVQKLPLAGPLRNPLYTGTNAAWFHPTNGVLMVARLDGPTPEIARGLVDKALSAETNGLWGRAYFDTRGITDGNYKLGDDWIRNASEIARRLGFETVTDTNANTFPAGFPMSHIAFYMGWYEADFSGPFRQPAMEFMPGAFAYHLHSGSAATVRSPTNNWVGPLLARGAAATMGCVFEPYLAGTPDLAVFAGRFLFEGFSFGESACAAQPALSWQTTVVGDPLYRPGAKNPDVLAQALQQRQSPLLDWGYVRMLNANVANGKPLATVVTFLEELAATKRSSVLSEKLADFYSTQGKPSSAAFAWRRALDLGPSPQQKLRLLLTLGEKLGALERAAEAAAAYERLLRDFPDYPDKLSVYRRLLPLARKLERTADADRYEAEINRLSPPPGQ